MAFDLGVSNYIAKKGAQKNQSELLLDSINALQNNGNNGWSLSNAVAYTQHILNAADGTVGLPDGVDEDGLINYQVSAIRDFLSLYALTKADGQAGLDGHVVNTTATDLFGGMITKVHIGSADENGNPIAGQNPYRNINAILGELGITSSPVKGHQNHFHIYLRPPAPKGITTTANLLAAESPDAVTTGSIVLADMQDLLDFTQTIVEGEELMFIMDVPYIPAQETPIVLAQATTPAATEQPDFILKDCQETESTGDSTFAFNTLSPSAMLKNYFRGSGRDIDSAKIKTILLEGALHGKLNDFVSGKSFTYVPEPNYVGNDKAVFMVEYEGKRYKIDVELHVFKMVLEDMSEDSTSSCPPPKLIKVNKPSSGDSGFGTGYSLASVSVNLADLPGGAVGQATGTTITLDTNAAGHNWYIDATPADNSEYLPASNPYEWVAKEGTAAYGKMDMLSVLLHEYGHALGIDHSTNNHDYMATTLTPGVRRMPSAEEMALMQQLVAQAKDGLVGRVTPADSIQQTAGVTRPTTPDNSPMPLPIPLGAGFGMAFIGRMRKGSYGGMNIDFASAPPITQYAVAANATFANLDSPAGWNTQGSVDIASGTSSATLNEISASQTRLSQVFMLNEQDRYLSFTLSGAALDDLNGAPDDAFDVALLDANTGLSVLGGTGLTRSDAFLNLQADGTRHMADCVTCIDNPDGSRTYRVDLTGVAKNTAVNLSFDLLGFGQDNSHVTLSDIRVSGLPQLHDDATSLPEDNLLTFDPFAQADSQLKPLLASHIVDAPTHGSLAVNADGTFAYTPDLDYFGTDSFSYRLSDGPLDSNLATGSLTITAVNDAPVAADVAVNTAEDTPLVIALGAYATDVDSTTLTTQIVTGPTYGVLTQNVDGSYSYTPDANYNGTDSFTYRVNDGALDSNIATVTLAIAAVNDAPQGANATVTTLEDTDYVFQLGDFGYSDAMDAGSNAGANNFSAVTITTLPLVGTLTNNGIVVVAGQRISVADIALGLLKFAPSANASGAGYASFAFQVQDDGNTANGGVDIDQTARTMTIEVTAVNDAPIAVDTQAATDEDTPLNLNLLAAASDVDGDVLTPVIIAGPLHGQLIQNADGTFNYLSDLNYFGTDSFTYKVNDAAASTGQGLNSNIVTVSLTIAAVNDAPVAVSASVTGPEDTPYIFVWSDFRVSDVDSTDTSTGLSTGLAVTINTLPVDGLLQYYDGLIWLEVIAGQRIVKADIDAGFLCFGPDANESGFDGYSTTGTGNLMQDYASFTYQADDGSLSSAVASMTINITPVADTPSLVLTAPVDAYGATAMLFSTSWESAPNRSPTSTVLPQCELEGWHAITPAGDPNNHFIVWSSGDKMKDANNTNRIVNAAPKPSL